MATCDESIYWQVYFLPTTGAKETLCNSKTGALEVWFEIEQFASIDKILQLNNVSFL
uniref:Uncharacterized protein n=1 Tax=Rhizophora mucronata TaxID=61149 RepID=A0A2P2IK34_RHIMU